MLGANHNSTTKRRVGRLGLCLIAAALMWACGPVFIPVPPPSQTAFVTATITNTEGQSQQVWIATGGPEPRASNGIYYIFDKNQNAGVIAGAAADGTYVAPPMAGNAGDQVLVYYKDTNGHLSATACLILSDQVPSAPLCP